MKYRLYFLKGTKDYVLGELKNKFPNIYVTGEFSEYIEFDCDVSNILEFRKVMSGYAVEADGRRIDLSKRRWRKEFVPAGINPCLAYIMCMVAGVNDNSIIYDPFCGAGVIPITALLYFSCKRAICSDKSGSAVEKSRINFEEAGIDSSKYTLFQSDICDVKLTKRNIDLIISNLPFGIRTGSHEENIKAYNCLEKIALKVLRRKGKLVLLTQEKRLLRETFSKQVWKCKSIIHTNEGGLSPDVFVIERKYSNTKMGDTGLEPVTSTMSM